MELDPQPISDEELRRHKERIADWGNEVSFSSREMANVIARLDAAEATLAEAHPLAPDDELRRIGQKIAADYHRLLSFVSEKGYVGRACRRTGWISEDNYGRMVDALQADRRALDAAKPQVTPPATTDDEP